MQDALLCPLVYLLVVTTFYGGDRLDPSEYAVHLRLAVLVAFAGLIASASSVHRLHGQSLADLLWHAMRFSAIVGGVALLIDALGRAPAFALGVVPTFCVCLALVLLANRTFLRWYYLAGRREHPDNHLKMLVVGSGPRARRLINSYRTNVEWQIDVAAVLDPVEEDGPAEIEGVPVRRGTDKIGEILSTMVIDEVVVCLPRSLIDNIQEIVNECATQAVCLRFMADLYDIDAAAMSLQKIGDIPMLTLEPVALDEGTLFCKRLIDLLGSGLAIALLAPFFALLVLLIKLDSPGPAFFVQQRVGLNKRTFPMIKFRSMQENAESVLKELEHLNEASGPIFKMERDPRVTRIGAWMRRTSVDELPQLFNVFAGHMSLVGPRPMSLRDVSQFSLAIQRRRFSVRPGLACLREVSGRSKLSFDQWLALDLHYIEHWSLWLDFRIMLKLVPVVLRGEGAT